MEGAVQHHRLARGYWALGYHFCIGRERFNNNVLGVFNGRPLPNVGGHGGSNGNQNSIGIAAVGDFNVFDRNNAAFVPDNVSDFIHNEMPNLIVDCLISFPSITRINRVGVNPTPVLLPGIMRHADVDMAHNSGCPGSRLNVNVIIRNAINMANTFTAAESIRTRQIPNIGIGTALPTSISWARQANELTTINFNVGRFIMNINERGAGGWRSSNNLRPASNVSNSIVLLGNSGVIPQSEVSFWQSNHGRVIQLSDLIISVARWIP